MKRLACCLIMFLFPFYAYSAPTITGISGSVVDNVLLTIYGSGFGTHGNLTTVQWLGGPAGNIESGTVGNEISLPSGWLADTTTTTRKKPEYSSTEKHSGSKSIKAYFPLTSQYTSGFTYNKGAAFSSTYATWWFRPRPISWETSGVYSAGAQFKHFRVTPGLGGGIYADQPHNWYWTQQMVDNGSNVPTFDGGARMLLNFCSSNAAPTYDSTCYPASGTIGQGIYRPYGTANGIWQRIEVWTRESSVATTDGTINVLIHKQNGVPVSYANFDGNVATRQSATPQWRYLVWENYWGNGVDKGEFFFDDIFIQFGTRARVEIGDKAVWSQNIHREIQIASAWLSNSITVTLNCGSFDPYQTYYLYVVDADGNVNTNGFPIKIGTEAGNPPQPTTNFEIIEKVPQ